ncbi:protein ACCUMULATION AND REPLICATION OF CHLOROPLASTS 3-like isoform X2 [Hibiscus syriacus]|uniref:protein ACCUMULATION AND REPLICATION OF CHLOROPLASTS 3-like isoform X2 n=1 Tax=Hibiscus syriacus TaxID=106335 RepID=UPI0019231ED7|nr:protein ACCUMULATION AND REPLICATION OF CHLOROPLASTS 3-like isoform X2 [Hibiscus syriacus]
MPTSSMSFPIFSGSRVISHISLSTHLSSNPVFFNSFFGAKSLCCKRLSYNPKSLLKISMSMEKQPRSLDGYEQNMEGNSGVLEVIAIGSRKDSLLEFCLDSPFQSSSLRFWTVLMKDASNVQLQQRVLGKDLTPRIVEADIFMQSCAKTIILVAGAGYGSDHIAAVDILKAIRSSNGFSVVIILKPFTFEGQRRLDEVNDLVGKLQELISFCIEIDTDSLLKNELVTLDEALRTANNAVILAINAISIVISEMQRKFIDAVHDNMKELGVSEVINILGKYKNAKLGFGAGYNIRTSISQAMHDCPFIGAGVKDLDGIVICVVASSNVISNDDLQAFLRTFRQTTEYTKDIIISVVHDPKLEPNLLVTTVVILGHLEEQTLKKSGFFNRLAQRFPFVFNLLRRDPSQSNDTFKKDVKAINRTNSNEMGNKVALQGIFGGFGDDASEIEDVPNRKSSDIYSFSGSDQNEVALLDGKTDFSSYYEENSEGIPTFRRESLNHWNLGPGNELAKEWAKERAADSEATPVLDNLSIFCLPVGVRSSEELKEGVNTLNAKEFSESKSENGVKVPALPSSSRPWGTLTDASFEVMKEIYNNGSTVLKGKTGVPKKQGVLSARAASMLEAERDSPKKWSPIVEMHYRGGVYRGRCQGGLPEGKGRLVLGDGNIYDGMWRYGKRSGVGTYYSSNGDVFQGSWRDDLMHGKGWFYFHTGDRWFANFWKGKANGEGRFYSKSGDVFFGHFEDGWRHGHFLCITVDGARCIEIWNEGVLIDRQQLDVDAVL